MSCPFLALPAELRQRIYTFIFQGPAASRTYTPEQQRRYSSGSQPEDEQPQGPRASYDILLTNKTTFDEALVLYYHLTTVWLSFCELVYMPMPSTQLSNARTVHLDAFCTEHTDSTYFAVDIVPRLQQLHRLDRLYLSPLTQSDEWGEDCTKPDATDNDMLSTLKEDCAYDWVFDWMLEAMPCTRIYFNVKGTSVDKGQEVDTVVKFLFRGAFWWSRRDTVDDLNADPDDWMHDGDTEMGTCDDSAQTQVIAAGRDAQGEDS